MNTTKRFIHKLFRCAFLIAAALSLFSPHASHAASATHPPDVTGYYFFVGKVPKEFENIDWISLASVDAAGKRTPLNGFIRLKQLSRGKPVNYKIVRLTLADQKLTFTTTTIGKIRYQFSGVFLKTSGFQDNETALKGRLIKLRNGREIARVYASFYYFTGD